METLIEAAKYDAESTFAMSPDVASMLSAMCTHHASTLADRKVVGNCGMAGTQVPSFPVVRKVSNIDRTFNTRSEKPGSRAESSATRSSE